MLVALTVGLIIWIVMWALGVKAFDAFLIVILLTLIAATARIASPFINKLVKPDPID